MCDVLSESICNKISELIFEMTNKNYGNIKEETLKELQNICKNSNIYIERTYSLLMNYLKKPHSEMRYNTFYVFNAFFKTHEYFRKLAVEDLKSIMDLVTDINWNAVLPPPKTAANELKYFFLKSVKEWMKAFGSSYRKLKLFYEFLLYKKQVDFEKMEIENPADTRRKEYMQKRKEKLFLKKLEALRLEIKDLKQEISNTQKSLESCLNMLIPTPEDFFINNYDNIDVPNTSLVNISNSVRKNTEGPDVSVTTEDENTVSLREIGMLPGNHSININFREGEKMINILETEENAIIIENARDYYKLLNKKYLQIIKNWEKILTTLPGTSGDLKEVIDLKVNLQNIMNKYEHVSFEKAVTVSENESDSDTDDMEDATPCIPTADEEIIANLKARLERPSNSSSDIQNEKMPGSLEDKVLERKRKLLEIAPRLPFDIDLYYWEEENLSAPILLPITAEGRQFWSASAIEDSDGIPVPDGVASLRTRTIEFTGKFEPVKWCCRFPLPSGKLCPRQDRIKCPFHGMIVARDETGKCVNPTDAERDKIMELKRNNLDVQNPELLAEIKVATGIDLKLPEKFKRKKKDDSCLTNIKKEQDTTYRRLEKKLFKRSTVKKVARTLDNLDQKRFRDKFGDQFQYIHNTA